MSKQSEALRLAELFEVEDDPESLYRKAAAELRKLHQMDADKTEVIAALSRNCDALLNAHAEIMRVHANDDVRPKAFYISAAVLKELEGKE